MPIRKSIVVGQIALLALGIFLLMVFFAILETQSRSFWYTGPAPAMFLIPAIACFIGVILLFSVVRYEVHKEMISYVCPNCGQKLPAGSKFCNNCGYKIK